eukprot:gene28241-35064_t
MEILQSFDEKQGYATSLVEVILSVDTDSSVEIDARHMAAILLKNLVYTRWSEYTSAGKKLISEDEKSYIRKFLVAHLHEPDCKLSNHLACCIGKIMRFDWPGKWPELIPSLIQAINTENNLLLNMRGMNALNEVMSELKEKVLACQRTKTVFNSLCVQLHPIISKVWCMSFKALQGHLVTIPLDVNTLSSSSTFGERNTLDEVKLYFLTKVSNIVGIILLNSFSEISVKFGSNFQCFWKTYINTYQMISAFLRKARPLTNALIAQAGAKIPGQQNYNADSYCPANANASKPHVMNAFQVAASKINTQVDEFSDGVVDYYLSPCLFNSNNAGLFTYLNLVLKLLKSLTCTPVMLQKRYPVEMVPVMQPLITFYYSHLVTEFKAVNAASENSATNTVQHLPLRYVTMAGIFFLGNVLACNDYYDAQPTPGTTELEAHRVALIKTAFDLRQSFYTTEVTNTLLSIMLNHTLALQETELSEWSEDSEQFYLTQNMLDECGNVRTASEALFVSLLDYSPKVVSDVILALLSDMDRQKNMVTFATQHVGSTVSLHKEVQLYNAVYLCAILGYRQLSQIMGADTTLWLKSFAGPMMNYLIEPHRTAQANNTNTMTRTTLSTRIILSRLTAVANAYAAHFPVTCGSCLRDIQLQLLHPVYGVDDVVVRMSAVRNLTTFLNMPFFIDNALKTINAQGADCQNKLINDLILVVQSCCVFVTTLNESDTKRNVLLLMQECVQLFNVITSPQKHSMLLPLAQYMGELWRVADKCDPIRVNIVEIFADLVTAANSQSQALHSIVLPVIAQCCAGTSNCLFREGLALWLTVMRNAQCSTCTSHVCSSASGSGCAYTQQLDDMFFTVMNNVFHRLQINVSATAASINTTVKSSSKVGEDSEAERQCVTEVIQTLLLVVEAYALVGKHQFVTVARNQNVLYYIYSHVIGTNTSCDPRLAQYVGRSLDALLVANTYTDASAHTMSSVVPEFLLNSGILVSILRVCLGSCNCYLLSGIFSEYKIVNTALVHYLNVVARVIVQYPSVFLSALTSLKNDIVVYL